MFRYKSLLLLFSTLPYSISTAWGLPPTGLTPIYTGMGASSGATIGVIDGTLYVSSFRGVRAVDETGVGEPRMFTLPASADSRATTERVVESVAGEPFFVTEFDDTIAVYGWDDFAHPLTTWTFNGLVLSGTPDGGVIVGSAEEGLAILHPDDDVTPIPDPEEEVNFGPLVATPNGWILGLSTIPEVLPRDVDVLINTRGHYERFGTNSTLNPTLRDRADGNGVNVGRWGSAIYGVGSVDRRSIAIFAPGGSVRERTLVSETDFAVMTPQLGTHAYAYYPGIDPVNENTAVTLVDVFPELQSLADEPRLEVADVASSEGQIHLLLSGENGLWLYAAPDPSVIPEPTAATLAVLAVGAMFSRRRR